MRTRCSACLQQPDHRSRRPTKLPSSAPPIHVTIVNTLTMVKDDGEKNAGGLVVGSYCHDVLFRDGRILANSLGGAASFISNILDPLSPFPARYVSKVGTDFAYAVPHPPILSPSSPTSLFHAHFSSTSSPQHDDRHLNRVHACDPIAPSDLPSSRFDFGLAVAVAGEIPPETLARMLDLCRVVFVDAQALIRKFDPVDGAVNLVPLRDTGFFHLVPRITFLKASAVEAPFVGVEEVRRWCCVVVTDGEQGCRVYWKDGEIQVPALCAKEVDPTGAGDSFLGGFALGLVRGLNLHDAALLGNFFGALTVGQIGVPKFHHRMLQLVRREVERVTEECGRSMSCDFQSSKKHEDFHACLTEVAKLDWPPDSDEQDDD